MLFGTIYLPYLYLHYSINPKQFHHFDLALVKIIVMFYTILNIHSKFGEENAPGKQKQCVFPDNKGIKEYLHTYYQKKRSI